MKICKWWVSCSKFTVKVFTNEDDYIVYAAPVVHCFVGQPLENLRQWIQKFGEVEIVLLRHFDD